MNHASVFHIFKRLGLGVVAIAVMSIASMAQAYHPDTHGYDPDQFWNWCTTNGKPSAAIVDMSDPGLAVTATIGMCGNCHAADVGLGDLRALEFPSHLRRASYYGQGLTKAQGSIVRVLDKTMPPDNYAKTHSQMVFNHDHMCTIESWIQSGQPDMTTPDPCAPGGIGAGGPPSGFNASNVLNYFGQASCNGCHTSGSGLSDWTNFQEIIDMRRQIIYAVGVTMPQGNLTRGWQYDTQSLNTLKYLCDL